MDIKKLMQRIKNSKVIPTIEYNDFSIFNLAGSYYYLNDDLSEAYELDLIACLDYDIMNDVNATGIDLASLFNCDITGEQITDNAIKYLWFKIKK